MESNNESKKKWFDHRAGAEWLSYEICEYYREKALKLSPSECDIGEWRELRKELQYECDITEIQAFNILRGRSWKEYVTFYQKMKENPDLWYK